MDSGATVNGRKPLPAATVEAEGKRIAAKESKPMASQVGAMGAGPGDGGGKHIAKPGASTPPLDSPAAAAERTTTGTTAEEQDSVAKRMYPSAKGRGGYGQNGGL